MRTIAILFIISAPFLHGCKKECLVPAGPYTMSFETLKGDCPEDLTAQFVGFTDVVQIPEERACQRFVTDIVSDVDGCRISMDVSAVADENGLSDGEGVFQMRCDGGAQCRHLFRVNFVQQTTP